MASKKVRHALRELLDPESGAATTTPASSKPSKHALVRKQPKQQQLGKPQAKALPPKSTGKGNLKRNLRYLQKTCAPDAEQAKLMKQVRPWGTADGKGPVGWL